MTAIKRYLNVTANITNIDKAISSNKLCTRQSNCQLVVRHQARERRGPSRAIKQKRDIRGDLSALS
jgi:hypothetical protein